MGEMRPNAEQRRLERVRALREKHYPSEAKALEELEEKDQQIADLERKVELLGLKLERSRPTPETGPATTGHHQHEVS